MKNAKITVLSAIAVAMLGTASFADGGGGSDCDRQNPGNGKCVGGAPFDGITGASGNNGGGPPADTMDPQRPDDGPQPGGS
jgi:hypothetical protein